MGQTASTPMVGHKPRHHPSVSSFRGSIRSALLPRRAQTAQGSLSATFHCVDSDLKLNQVNINTATEEELMTLPGINRAVAQSIVEYRRQIGRFNKPEDLALVSGVGAEKLASIRPEICVRKRMTDRGSIGSSHASSMESLEPISMLPPSPSPSSARPAVDINTASVFELMTVRGLTQETAAAIVEYRTRRGPFRSVDALAKVKGISNWKLGALRCQLTVSSPDQPVANGKATLSLPIANGNVPGSKSINTSPSTPNGFLTPEAIFEVLSPMCERPFISAVDSKGGVRVASWCLSPEFSAAKAGNLGVQEVVCRTILENRFAVIALQGACDELALKKVVSELNHPKLKRVLEWKSNNRAWKTSMPATNNKAGLVFLYNSQAVHLLSPPAEINLGPIGDNILALPEGISAVLAEFKVPMSELTVSLLNVSVGLQPSQSSPVTAEFVEKALAQRLGAKPRHLAILGDFTGLALGPIAEETATNLQYKSILAPGTNTSSTGQICLRDNIFLGKEAQRVSSGFGGVVRQGLTHLAIPKDWEWGGTASDHCPVWCELKTTS